MITYNNIVLSFRLSAALKRSQADSASSNEGNFSYNMYTYIDIIGWEIILKSSSQELGTESRHRQRRN